jgi:signal transduction histidine kinase
MIAALFLLQGAIETALSQRADTHARRYATEAVASVEELTSIIHGVDQQHLVLSGHLFGKDEALAPPDAIIRVERELAVLQAEVRRAARAYEVLATAPGEAVLWRRVRRSLTRYQDGALEVLSFERQKEQLLARGRVTALRREHAELSRDLVDLLRINRRVGAQALDELEAIGRRNQRLQWGVRLAGLILLLLLGFWGLRRVERYEEQLAAHSRDLEGRNRELDAFAGRVAHDLKNALVPIAMSSFTLRKASNRPSKVLEIAERTERSSRKATDIIDALLAFSRSSQGAEQHQTAALRPVVQSVLEELSAAAAELEVAIDIDIDQVADVELRCSPALLHIVLANLCGNAVKFLAGQAERRVHIRARSEGAQCRLEVEDTGPGIPPSMQEEIFRPFVRVEGASAPGTGLGLATVRRILEARGGRAAVESTPGKGARFTVWLPLASAGERQHLPAS